MLKQVSHIFLLRHHKILVWLVDVIKSPVEASLLGGVKVVGGACGRGKGESGVECTVAECIREQYLEEQPTTHIY